MCRNHICTVYKYVNIRVHIHIQCVYIYTDLYIYTSAKIAQMHSLTLQPGIVMNLLQQIAVAYLGPDCQTRTYALHHASCVGPAHPAITKTQMTESVMKVQKRVSRR